MGIAPLERDAVNRFQSFSLARPSAFDEGASIPFILRFVALKSVLLSASLIMGAFAVSSFAETNQPTVILVVGAAGEPEFGSNFVQQVQIWDKICNRAEAKVVRIGQDTNNSIEDHDLLKQALAVEQTNVPAPLWLVFVGHGTFDGKEARFNLRGPDISDTELAEWLKPFQRPLVVINCASASAPFLKTLSGTNRVIITATRSGNELNFTRFGQYFAKALDDPETDLDKDGQVSLLEAFLVASRRVNEFYRTEGRLITEHALIDDNGDGQGTPADWFHGVRATKKAKEGASLDGPRANQMHLVLSKEELALPAETRAQRDALELSVAKLRESKSQMPEADYYRQLETLLLQLARLQQPELSTTNPVGR
jgi:hypothetical protein